MGMDNSRTTIYHAAGNGMTERFNRTLISMLGTLELEKKEKLETIHVFCPISTSIKQH